MARNARRVPIKYRGGRRQAKEPEVLLAVAAHDHDRREHTHDGALRIAGREPAEQTEAAEQIGGGGGLGQHAEHERDADDPEVDDQRGLHGGVALFVRAHKRDEAQHEQRHLHDAHEIRQVMHDVQIARDGAGDHVTDQHECARACGDGVDLFARGGEKAEQTHGGKHGKAQQQCDGIAHAEPVRPEGQNVQQRLQDQNDEQDRRQLGCEAVAQGVFFFGHISSPFGLRNHGYRSDTRWPQGPQTGKTMRWGGAARRRCCRCGRGRCTVRRRRHRLRP